MTRPAPALINLYRAATWLGEPFAPILMAQRGAKEDRSRAGERLGKTLTARPDKPVIWLHGASIGELMSALPLAKALRDRGAFVLLTSGTRSSAGILGDRLADGSLGHDIVHQFVPLDFPRAIGRFLDHWQPQLALFMEQEIWPNMLAACQARAVPCVLVNGRLSARSFGRWQKRGASAAYLFSQFDLCLAQSASDAERFEALGARAPMQVGNLKISAGGDRPAQADLNVLAVMIGARPVWLAASTHPGEEQIIGAVHTRVKQTYPDLLTMIVPRHAERGAEIAALLGETGLVTVRRSKDEAILPDTDIYLADTFGELALFYGVAPVAFIGGSLVDIGGHNPIEAIAENCAVITGPHINNFDEMYRAFGTGCLHVGDGSALAQAVTLLLGDSDQLAAQNGAARDRLATMAGTLDRVVEALVPYLAKMEIG